MKWHVGEVLNHLDELALSARDRRRLRLAALVHDAFKNRVDRKSPRTAPNEHGYQAALWAQGWVRDRALLTLIELHDEGYRAWRAQARGDEEQCQRRLAFLVRRMGADLPLFLAFWWADVRSGAKDPSQIDWFLSQIREMGLEVAPPRTKR